MDALLLLAVLAALLCFPQVCMASALEALRVWGLSVVPSLFPYMVFSRLLSSALHRRGVPAALCVPLLGLAGGSPSGSAALSGCARSSVLSRRTLYSLAALTGTISPMFFLGTLQSWSGDALLARRLLLCHLFGAGIAAACAFLFAGAQHVQPSPAQSSPPSLVQEESPIVQSVQAVLNVGGCIVVYSVLAACASLLLPSSATALRAVLHAALEAAGGAHALIAAPLPTGIRAVLLAAMTSFGGLSILTQNALFLRPLGLRLPRLALYGLLRALGAAALMALLMR